jgi:hypothetical protein
MPNCGGWYLLRMPESQLDAQLRTILVSRAGGYLRNPIRQPLVTCAVCTTPCPNYMRCIPCSRQRGWPLADAVAPLTYAVAGHQSGYVMRGYKAPSPVVEHQEIVLLLCILAISAHTACAGVLVGAPVTHWATIPSLPEKPGEHPLHKLVGKYIPGIEVTLTAAAQVANTRDVNPGHFRTDARLSSDSHVMLLDDTWTSGGHAQSAVLAVRAAGAGHVSVLVVARWVKEDFGDNAQFLRGLPDYNPRICPWTGGGCPQ